MKNLSKKLTCLLLALLLCAGTFFANAKPMQTQAATKYDTLYTSSAVETATAGVDKSTSFTVSHKGDIYMMVLTSAPTTFSLVVTDAANQEIDDVYNVTPETTGWVEESGAYCFIDKWTLNTGTYNYVLNFADDTQYMLNIAQEAVAPTLSNSKLIMTSGFTKTLKVANANGAKIKWTSSNKKVATVSSKGVVTARKAGACKIAANVNGTKLTCTVSVKSNVYNDKKLTNSGFPYGKCYVYAYKAIHDSKGNIVLKVRVVNNTANTVTKLSGMKFRVKAANKKTVASYSAGTKNITVYSDTCKDFTITIPKSKIKAKKKLDLRNLYDIDIDGQYYYRY